MRVKVRLHVNPGQAPGLRTKAGVWPNPTPPTDLPVACCLLLQRGNRWTAHCVLGTVVRFHQGDHRFWLRDTTTQDQARKYLNMRYKLIPSLIVSVPTYLPRTTS